ncbi:hypothetical protein KI387_028828, partial [Taxus chinensis]
MGVAAMLALVGFASLLLVCTWWRLANADLRENRSTQQQPNLESMESGPVKPEVTCSASH